MISIITAIYNQLPMNQLYYQNLCRVTDGQWELIIVDNGSTDGSIEYFEAQPNVTVIRNDGNYSYPYCQNVGIRAAKGEVLAFLNNDIILSSHWDSRLMEVLGKQGCEITSLCSNDRMPDAAQTRRVKRRWKRIKGLMLTLFGSSRWSLNTMAKWMYRGRFEQHCEAMWQRYGTTMRLGFSGSAVIMTRKGLEMIGGGWDATQQGADFDIFLQTQALHQQGKPIQPLHIINGIYHHHYCRITLYAKYPPYKDRDQLVSGESKWGDDVMKETIAQLKKINTMIPVSYAITVCNEAKELEHLILHLKPYLHEQDEIVVQADKEHVTEAVKEVVTHYADCITTYAEHPLQRDFAQAKNHLNSLCKGKYIFQLDADEIPQAWLLEHLQSLLQRYCWVGLFKLPRINSFTTPDGQIMETRIAWPDYQGRIYRNTPRIHWYRPLHERIRGQWFYWHFPKDERYAIIHTKVKQQDAAKWREWYAQFPQK